MEDGDVDARDEQEAVFDRAAALSCPAFARPIEWECFECRTSLELATLQLDSECRFVCPDCYLRQATTEDIDCCLMYFRSAGGLL
jgi:hypothetical protein